MIFFFFPQYRTPDANKKGTDFSLKTDFYVYETYTNFLLPLLQNNYSKQRENILI